MNAIVHKARALALIPLLFTAVAGAEEMAHDMARGHAAPSIMVHDAWVRAVPPASRMSAAYLRLENGGAADRLVGASSPIAGVAEIHNVRSEGGMMQMFQVDGVDLPANGSVALKPGGYHIMLIDLKQTPVAGEQVELTLNFRDAGEVKVTAPVKQGAMAGTMGGMGHGHGH